MTRTAEVPWQRHDSMEPAVKVEAGVLLGGGLSCSRLMRRAIGRHRSIEGAWQIMSIKWAQQSVYALVPADLGLNGLQWSIDPPAGWSKSSARGAHEETLQTLLSLHLSEVSGAT